MGTFEILLAIAAIIFLLAALPRVTIREINLVPTGLLFMALAFLLGGRL
jgi:hypothetical protein